MGVSFTNETVDPKLKYAVRGMGLFFSQGLPFLLQRDAKAKGAKTDLIVNPDTQMGKVGTGLWSGAARVAGLQVLDPIYFNPSTTDFGPLATKVTNAHPDFVELPYWNNAQLTDMIGALRDVGFKGYCNPGNVTPYILEDIVKRVGKQFVEGWECVYFDPKDFLKDPEMISLVDRYQKEYKEWHYEGCLWIGPWFLFKDAVESTKSIDVDTIVRYLRNSKKAVKTFDGYTQLVARPDLKNYMTVDAVAGGYVGVIKDGKLAPLKIIPVKDTYLISIEAMGLGPVYKKYWQEYGRPAFPQQPSVFDYSDMK
jgi:ABC-type branched-subunit amino acid transport system substrate-binding protein